MPNKLLILNQQSKVWLILISLWIINGSSFIAIKVAIDTIPPLLSAGLRFSISGAILFTIFFFQRARAQRKYHYHNLQQYQVQKHTDAGAMTDTPTQDHITKQQWKHSLVLGLTLFVGGQGLLTWGAQYLSSGITGLLNSTIPLWVAIIGYLIYKEKKKAGVGQN